MKSLPKLLLSYLKKVFSDLHGVIIGIIVGFLLSGATIYLFFESLWIWIKTAIQLPTPLWVTTALVLLIFVYLTFVLNRPYKKSRPNNSTNTKNRDLITKFGIYWDNDLNPHCPNCKIPLGNYTELDKDAPCFHCARCKELIFMTDENGKHLTLPEALSRFKKL